MDGEEIVGSIINKLIIVLGGITLSFVATWLLRSLSTDAISSCFDTFKTATRNILCCHKRPSASDEVWLLVHERLKEEKLRLLRRLTKWLCAVFTPLTIWVIADSLQNLDAAPLKLLKLVHVVQHLLLAGLSLWPEFWTARNVNAVCVSLLLFSLLGLTPWSCPAELVTSQVLRALCFWAGVVLARPGQTLFLVTCLLVPLSSWGALSLYFATSTQMSVIGSVVTIQTIWTIVSRSLERGAELAHLARLQCQDAEESHSAACALLRSCCDVVVDLNSEGAIKAGAQDLASYLMRGKRLGLHGLPLADLIVDDDDRMLFRDRLLAKHEDAGTTIGESMFISIRDGNDNVVRVEILWFRYHLCNAQQLNFKAGIRECFDAPEWGAMEAYTRQPAVLVQSCALEECVSTVETSCTSSSSMTYHQEAIAVLDCTRSGYPVQEVTPCFCRQIGPMAHDEPFTRCLRQPEAFGAWVRSAIFRAMNGDGCPARCRVLFKMPQGDIRASCELVHEGTTAFQADLNRIALRFLQMRRCAEPGREGRCLKGTPPAAPRSVGL